jgi:hypothetical protein
VVVRTVGTVVDSEAVEASEAVESRDVAGVVCTVVGLPACAFEESGSPAETATTSDPDATPIRKRTRITVIV